MTQSSGDHDEIVNRHRGRRHKRPTACSAIRGKTGCGICGSENIAAQGVVFCLDCGAETEFLIGGYEYWGIIHRIHWEKDVEPPCSCLRPWKGRNGKTRYSRPVRSTYVVKCLDCGAVKRPRGCPNDHEAWAHWDGRRYCSQCGYRRDK